jgi:hypothetical protein
MYGDTTVIRGLARTLREQGSDVRREAERLLAEAEAVAWEGLAADAMRALARRHSTDLRECCRLHEAAADALDHHAREVQRLQDLIAAIEHRVMRLLDGTTGGLHSVLSHVLPDAVDRWLAGFTPPPRGSREWLDVHVPSAA